MKLNKEELISQIESKTGMKFMPDNPDLNLCFRNNIADLRDEFKEAFTENDLQLYLKYFGENQYTLPADSLDFWRIVKLAQK